MSQNQGRRNTEEPPSSNGTDDAITVENINRTYTGLLDDVMLRYSDEYSSEEFFNKMIAKNIFFGGGLYMNDGYLVNHPIARKHLCNENSLLRVMIDTNFIRILTRTRSSEDLSLMPKTMAGQGNESFQRLIHSSEWEDFYPIYSLISQSAFRNNNARSWPDRNLSYSFCKLMRDRVFDTDDPVDLGIGRVSRDEWLRIRDNFLNRDPEISGPRDKLEKAAQEILTETQSNPKEALSQIMMVANQAYHYNFGLALTTEPEEKYGVAVDTTIGKAFDELLDSTEIVRGQLDRLPIMHIPKDLPFDRGHLFLNLVRPSTSVSQAKVHYLNCLRSLISGSERDHDLYLKDLVDATAEYKHRIKELFGFTELEAAFDDSFTLAVGNLGSISATAGPTAGIAIEMQRTSKQKGTQFLFERFKLREEYDQNDVIRIEDIHPHIASLAFDKDIAYKFMEDVPPAPQI